MSGPPMLAFADATALILEEVTGAARAIDAASVESAAAVLLSAKRVFALGAGRSGLALRMGAMRLMHLGLEVHVAGEVTAPAIGPDDVLLAVSGSGTTAGIVHGAEVARAAAARVIAITTESFSPLAAIADPIIWIPAAGKADRSGRVSAQYAGSLFEQTVVVLLDALFEAMRAARGIDARTLWARHANLE